MQGVWEASHKKLKNTQKCWKQCETSKMAWKHKKSHIFLVSKRGNQIKRGTHTPLVLIWLILIKNYFFHNLKANTILYLVFKQHRLISKASFHFKNFFLHLFSINPKSPTFHMLTFISPLFMTIIVFDNKTKLCDWNHTFWHSSQKHRI